MLSIRCNSNIRSCRNKNKNHEQRLSLASINITGKEQSTYKKKVIGKKKRKII